jgi:formate dehydrogenase iron-sulfur subunit
MSYAKLIDTTKCIGCHACQVSCKEWNGLDGVPTQLQTDSVFGTYQNPTKLDADTFMLITHHEVDDPKAPAGFRDIFTKRQCMHCDEPACVSACPVTALKKSEEGPVVYHPEICIGCRYCMWACPFGAISAEWNSLAPKISKCSLCSDRLHSVAPLELNGKPLTLFDQKRYVDQVDMPACVKACPADALHFGDREDMLKMAKDRIAGGNGKYIDHIYGEKEAGGTATLYLSSVPFDKIGLPDVSMTSYPARSAAALAMVPRAVIAIGALLGAVYRLGQRKLLVGKAEVEEHHVEFAPLQKKFWTPASMLLVALMVFGAISFVARFALGLGGSTHLSDTYAWGLWIVFDLIWIAVAAGAFATAGIIYVFRRQDLYGIGRSAVLIGLLSYSFVTVTLVADLGLPWHFWQLGVQAPEHSAMFEVSWCVGLYVTILAFEFMPVVFEHLGMQKAMARWKTGAPLWVVVAVTLFVWLMSRNPGLTALAFVVFAFLAWAFRPAPEEKHPVPIMLAIAAVTLSTMHQSSLGSLFLLMPDKLDAAWWSPMMPVWFFVSSIAAGLSLVILVEMWMARAWGRALPIPQLASLGKLGFWALLVFEAGRVSDLAIRGQLGAAFSGSKAMLFAAEVLLGGLVPLVILGVARLRENPKTLFWGALLACGGVVLDRANVVVFAMDLKGTMPFAPDPYLPSLFEWGVSIGLIAATIFLFGWGVRNLPVLPKQEPTKA